MTLIRLDAIATTCRIEPGREIQDFSGVHVQGRIFTDRVESSDERLDGTNRVTLDIDFNPAEGAGRLEGSFEFDLTSRAGAWKGRVAGRFEGGLVVAEGIARGAGVLDGAVLHIEYLQIANRPGPTPCTEPLAFFSIRGLMLPSP